MVGTGSSYVEHTGPLTAAGTTYMGGNRCKRCGGSVYHAEELLGAGLVNLVFFLLCLNMVFYNCFPTESTDMY